MSIRKQILDIVYHEKDVERILSVIREALPKKKNEDIYNDDELLGQNIYYNQALSDIIRLLKEE